MQNNSFCSLNKVISDVKAKLIEQPSYFYESLVFLSQKIFFELRHFKRNCASFIIYVNFTS